MPAKWLARFTLSVLSVLAVALSGCVGPIGPGCHSGHCYDCDGTNRPIPQGPFQGIRQQLICGGGGCGEVYIGEWISTPPDCQDPCCGDQFLGGAVKARPFCWQPGSLLDLRRFSGRFPEGRAGCDSCGMGDCGMDGCGSGDYFDGGHIEGGVMSAPMMHQGSSGCSTCSNRGMGGGTHYAQNSRPMNQPANGRTQMAQTPPRSQVKPVPAGMTRVASSPSRGAPAQASRSVNSNGASTNRSPQNVPRNNPAQSIRR